MDNQNQFVPPVSPAQSPVQTPLPIIVQQKPKMKLWKKILIGFVILLIILGIGFYNIPLILTLLYPGDTVLVDNSNLLLQKVSIPDEDNGFFDLEKITNDTLKIPKNSDGILFNKEYTDVSKPIIWDQKLVDQVLKDNEGALSLINNASNKKYIQISQLSDPAKVTIDTPLPQMNVWRTIAELQAIKAVSLSMKGKSDEALQEAIKINDVGHKLIIGRNNLIGVLVGASIERIGSATILRLLSKNTSNKNTIGNIITVLKSSDGDLDGYRNAFRFEYMNIIRSIDQLVSNIKASPKEVESAFQQTSNEDERMSLEYSRYIKYSYYYKPNQNKNLYTNLFSPQVLAFGTRCDVPGLDEQIKSVKDELSNSRLIFTENAIGKILFSFNAATLSTVVTKQCQTDFQSNVVIIELALKEYKLDHKTLPMTLDDLVPTYLPSIPLDPFDHKPIRYSVEKKILYSVGLKQKDLGGSIGNDWTQMDNPTFKIEF